MELISINVGLPREVSWQGKTVSTAIFKSPVEGSVKLHTFNLDGDAQADLTVHGGVHKAAYAYPVEHYALWEQELADVKLTPGQFGENFTTRGLLENAVNIGDILRIGSTVIQVTEPRVPCYKLGLRFGRPDMVKRFMNSGRSGFYVSVLEEGTVEAGDTFEFVERDRNRIRVADITRLYAPEKDDWETIRNVVELETLPDSWREYFQHRLDKHDESTVDR